MTLREAEMTYRRNRISAAILRYRWCHDIPQAEWDSFFRPIGWVLQYRLMCSYTGRSR